ncbi:efflux transporter outer membrane subunit [Sphingomonas naphthae]|uniref:Efflux transporter outer membrane subunit n=1 Tax=Sphingomonas naphthae TaxID=1813468 RepID=A0ABY7TJC4_9SPHN|nr:efflux transporter outer membrane subunit [Sphingomonas naphthae]WCT72822.1 efflux transporter outer membrane subunit [Sphingomonas naphthae]
MSRRSVRIAACTLLLLSGAAQALGPVKPDTHASLAPAGSPGFVARTIAPDAGPAQRIAAMPPVAGGAWWTAFANADLDALVDRALAANEDIKVAEAALVQAREQGRAASGQALPQIDAGYQAQRARTSAAIAPPLADPANMLYTLHTAQLGVTYPLDLFGGTRSRIASARAAADVQGHRTDAARRMVVANLVLAVIQHGMLSAEIRASGDSIDANQRLLDMLRRRQQLGDVGATDVAAQEASLAAARMALPTLQHARDHQTALIATLLGVAPGNPLPPLPALDALTLPADLPLTLPAEIVQSRPDVAAAEAQMRGAAADVGTAIAARLPSIQLSAQVGGSATKFGDMFVGGNPFWSLIGGLTQPLFHGGALLHQKHAADAALKGAEAQYRGAVLQAFADVSDALSGLDADAAALDAATLGDAAAGRNLAYVTRQLQLGDVGTLTLLNATSVRANAALQLIQTRAARMSDTVAFFQATGAGVVPR